MMNDPVGTAISDYYKNGKAESIKIETNYTAGERLSPSYFFRSFQKMPPIEQTALKLCQGKVLDVGAAAGCHALTLQGWGLEVIALEKSELAAEVMRQRGVINVVCADLFQFTDAGFDTIIVLMNGTGIGGTTEGLKTMLRHLKSLLNKKGSIIIDSSDISYLFQEDDGSFWVNLTGNNYYGEMEYKVKYKNLTSVFNWLFVDFELLKALAAEAGFNSKLVEEGTHFEYLAQLTLR